MTVTAVGKQVSERRPSEAEIDRWADAIADMLTVHLARLAPRRSAARARKGLTHGPRKPEPGRRSRTRAS